MLIEPPERANTPPVPETLQIIVHKLQRHPHVHPTGSLI